MENPELEKIRYYKGNVADFKKYFDDRAKENTNAYDMPPYQGYGVLNTTGKKDSEHWKTSNITEDDYLDPNDESDMIQGQLENMMEDIDDILMTIQDGQQFDAWVQSKIANAADYINAVKRYLNTENI
jgi:hypothetical protein